MFFYFKSGYAVYLGLLISSVNVLTSTYFLAIDNTSFIKEIFPTFEMYILTVVMVAIPVITIVGYVHYKQVGAHSANIAIGTQNTIYNYRFQPGFTLGAFGPAYRMILVCILKHTRSEKFTDRDIEQIDHLRARLKHLIDGGAVGEYAKGVIDD